MMFFFLIPKQIKNFLQPPPPPRRKGTNGRDKAPRTHVCLYQQHVTWSFTRSRLSDSTQSNPLIKNYHLIIIAFSRQYFSIYDIFIQKKARLISTQGRLTLIFFMNIMGKTHIQVSGFRDLITVDWESIRDESVEKQVLM